MNFYAMDFNWESFDMEEYYRPEANILSELPKQCPNETPDIAGH